MYYEAHGEGYPLIMIQGYSGSSQGWNNLAPILDEISKHYQAIQIDNRGIGGTSAPPGEYSIRKMADDVAGLLDALKIPRAHVLGNSMGGMIAQELAINYPEKVKTLVLVSTFPGGSTLDSIKGQREAFEKLSWFYSTPPGITPGAVLTQMLKMIFRPKFLENNMAKIMSSMKGTTPTSTLERHYDAIMKFNAYPRLGMIRSKTLVIHGACDELIMPECGEILARLIPGSRLLMCEDASHMVLEEKWSEVRPVILDFLSQV
jgi:pimeloyl-ACP methyl ester carboxylesterase